MGLSGGDWGKKESVISSVAASSSMLGSSSSSSFVSPFVSLGGTGETRDLGLGAGGAAGFTGGSRSTHLASSGTDIGLARDETFFDSSRIHSRLCFFVGCSARNTSSSAMK